jgi:hypothetical protein
MPSHRVHGPARRTQVVVEAHRDHLHVASVDGGVRLAGDAVVEDDDAGMRRPHRRIEIVGLPDDADQRDVRQRLEKRGEPAPAGTGAIDEQDSTRPVISWPCTSCSVGRVRGVPSVARRVVAEEEYGCGPPTPR